MPLQNILVYNFASGDNTYPHTGTFTVGVAGQVTVDDSDGVDDVTFGDFTHTGGADTDDQDVTASSVAGISVGDTIDLRYKYTVTGSDGSSGTIHFTATNSELNYGPMFVSDFPLTAGVTYTFGTFNTDGAAPYSSLVPCFTSGTQIMTIKGSILIEALNPGDLVLTRDNGFQPLRWIGKRTVRALGKHTPILVPRGALGSNSNLLVSPNHRMLICEAIAEMYFGERELLVAAKHLVGMNGISKLAGGMVTYIHVLFDSHQIVVGNGAFSESFFPGPMAIGSLDAATQSEVLDLFPELNTDQLGGYGQTARLCLTKAETCVLRQIAA
jgi:hypothetical protein